MFAPLAGRRPQDCIFWLEMFAHLAGRQPREGIFWAPKIDRFAAQAISNSCGS